MNHSCERYRNADDGEKRLNLTVLGQVLQNHIRFGIQAIYDLRTVEIFSAKAIKAEVEPRQIADFVQA